MATASGTGNRRGRPPGPSAAVVAAVVEASAAELADVGFDGFRMERVAVRAGIHRSTLYRHWPGRRELLLEVARDGFVERLVPPDTGSWPGDLAAMVDDIARATAEPANRALMAALATAQDPDLRQVVLDMWRAQLAPHVEPIRRARERGEIRALDPGLLLEAIAAPVVLRIVVTGIEITDVFRTFHIDTILRSTRP